MTVLSPEEFRDGATLGVYVGAFAFFGTAVMAYQSMPAPLATGPLFGGIVFTAMAALLTSEGTPDA